MSILSSRITLQVQSDNQFSGNYQQNRKAIDKPVFKYWTKNNKINNIKTKNDV